MDFPDSDLLHPPVKLPSPAGDKDTMIDTGPLLNLSPLPQAADTPVGLAQAQPDAPAVPASKGQSRPPALASLPSPGQLWQCLRQRWMLAMLTGLLGAAITTVLLQRLLPQTHTASAWLRLERPTGSDRVAEGAPAQDDKDAPRLHPPTVLPHPFRPADPLLIKSPTLLARILEQPEVCALSEVKAQASPQAWLDHALQLETSGQVVFRLTATSENAETAPQLVAAAVQVYLQALREQRQAYLALLQEQQRRCTAGQPGTTIVPSPDAGVPPGDPRLAQAEKALEQARFELKKLLAEQTVLQGQAANLAPVAVPAGAIDEQVDKDPRTQGWLNELKAQGGVEDMIREIRRTSAKGESDPLLKRYVGRREALQSALQQRRDEIVQGLEKQARDRAREELDGRTARLKERLTLAGELERGLQEEVKSLRAAHPGAARQEPRADDQTVRQAALRRLGTEILLLELEGEANVGVERLGEVETAATRPERRGWLMGLGAGSTFVFLVLAVAWLEFEGRRVRSPRALPEGLDLPVLGTLPAVPLPSTLAPTGVPGVRDLASQNRLAEAIDVARTLLLQKVGDGPAVILVAGAGGREGTTSVACQLALSLARAWRRTLLIDGHLRRPTVHELFRLPQDPGLAEVLRGEVEAADAINPTRASRLWVLPGGHWDNHALQALAQEREGFVFDALRRQYDVVVIDAGPVLPLADALLLGRHADAAVLAVLSDRSRLPAVHEARQRLVALGLPVLGAVVSGSR